MQTMIKLLTAVCAECSGKPGSARQHRQQNDWPGMKDTHLLETHVLSVLTEALTADVQAVLPDDAPLVSTNTAARQHRSSDIINSMRNMLGAL